MNDITSAVAAFTGAFAGVVALALLVTGFFIGRGWMYRLTDEEKTLRYLKRESDDMHKLGL